jgi:hypothetical protein
MWRKQKGSHRNATLVKPDGLVRVTKIYPAPQSTIHYDALFSMTIQVLGRKFTSP